MHFDMMIDNSSAPTQDMHMTPILLPFYLQMFQKLNRSHNVAS